VIQKSVQEMMEKLTGKNIMICPCCGKGTLHVVEKSGDRLLFIAMIQAMG
jgi:hypothetical protein